ncbi:cytochrome b [Kerstersia gyiorum]|uniref:cytochrome b n=1 Tax=Kerstersia gyiorum TaxID=206506 RepID=UPI00242CC46E|nr:cytochrome b [Kerstersia gyiorum]MCH4271939.1 cytochrome b [Kerstersia gyiorum]MCI1230245.1 cytochrome b [Kerstersia gyiorum]
MPKPQDTQYAPFAKLLHWLIALLMPGILALGFYMQDLPFSPGKLQLYSWHKWLGVTVFLLALVRLGYRLGHPPPALPAHMNRLERLAAHGGHLALYALMLSIPLSGWLMSSAKGVQTVWFGVLPLPDLLARDRALGDTLAQVHAFLNFAFLGMLLLHTLAALKHQFIDKDGLLARMLPRCACATGKRSSQA